MTTLLILLAVLVCWLGIGLIVGPAVGYGIRFMEGDDE